VAGPHLCGNHSHDGVDLCIPNRGHRVTIPRIRVRTEQRGVVGILRSGDGSRGGHDAGGFALVSVSPRGGALEELVLSGAARDVGVRRLEARSARVGLALGNAPHAADDKQAQQCTGQEPHASRRILHHVVAPGRKANPVAPLTPPSRDKVNRGHRDRYMKSL